MRLWIDRSFHIRDAGTVITGTLTEGTIATGDRFELDGIQVRVRGLESLEVPRTQISGIARVAVNLGGRAPKGIRRGRALVTPATGAQTSVIDVRLYGEVSPPERPVLHVGSASQEVRVRPLAGPLVRLQLSEPMPLRNQDRAALRDPGTGTLWGGPSAGDCAPDHYAVAAMQPAGRSSSPVRRHHPSRSHLSRCSTPSPQRSRTQMLTPPSRAFANSSPTSRSPPQAQILSPGSG